MSLHFDFILTFQCVDINCTEYKLLIIFSKYLCRMVSHGKGILQTHELLSDFEALSEKNKLADGPFGEVFRHTQVINTSVIVRLCSFHLNLFYLNLFCLKLTHCLCTKNLSCYSFVLFSTWNDLSDLIWTCFLWNLNIVYVPTTEIVLKVNRSWFIKLFLMRFPLGKIFEFLGSNCVATMDHPCCSSEARCMGVHSCQCRWTCCRGIDPLPVPPCEGGISWWKVSS